MEALVLVRVFIVITTISSLLSAACDLLVNLVLRILLVQSLHFFVSNVAEAAVHDVGYERRVLLPWADREKRHR